MFKLQRNLTINLSIQNIYDNNTGKYNIFYNNAVITKVDHVQARSIL
jgi:hypothetical protein